MVNWRNANSFATGMNSGLSFVGNLVDLMDRRENRKRKLNLEESRETRAQRMNDALLQQYADLHNKRVSEMSDYEKNSAIRDAERKTKLARLALDRDLYDDSDYGDLRKRAALGGLKQKINQAEKSGIDLNVARKVAPLQVSAAQRADRLGQETLDDKLRQSQAVTRSKETQATLDEQKLKDYQEAKDALEKAGYVQKDKNGRDLLVDKAGRTYSMDEVFKIWQEENKLGDDVVPFKQWITSFLTGEPAGLGGGRKIDIPQLRINISDYMKP